MRNPQAHKARTAQRAPGAETAGIMVGNWFRGPARRFRPGFPGLRSWIVAGV